jgi:hypothetical protein
MFPTVQLCFLFFTKNIFFLPKTQIFDYIFLYPSKDGRPPKPKQRIAVFGLNRARHLRFSLTYSLTMTLDPGLAAFLVIIL